MVNTLIRFTLSLALLICSLALAQEKPFDVRGHTWGEVPEEVKKKESGSPFEQHVGSTILLLYLAQLALSGQPFHASFFFFQDRLFSIVSMLSAGKQCQELSSLLDDTVTELTLTYGAPTARNTATTCKQQIDWRIGDSEAQFKAETDRLGFFDVSIVYRHLPTARLVREADLTNTL